MFAIINGKYGGSPGILVVVPSPQRKSPAALIDTESESEALATLPQITKYKIAPLRAIFFFNPNRAYQTGLATELI